MVTVTSSDVGGDPSEGVTVTVTESDVGGDPSEGVVVTESTVGGNPSEGVKVTESDEPSESGYTVVFRDKYGNRSVYHALTKQQAQQIAKEYAKYYPGESVSIRGSPPNPAQSPDVEWVAQENALEPHYRVIFKDSEGNSTYTALTLQQAEKIAEEYRKYYKGRQVLILTPNNELERVTFRQNRVPRSAPPAPSPSSSRQVSDVRHDVTNNQESSHNVTDVKATKPTKPTPSTLDLDGALHRAAVDNENAQLAAAYAQKLLDEGKSPQEIQKALQGEYGVQADIETLTFKESPEAAMYKQIESKERVRKAAVEAQKAVDSAISSISPEYSLISGLNKLGRGIESKAKQLNEAAMKNTNPAIAYAEAVGAALLGAGAGVAELPKQTVEFAASAVKNPVKAVKSLLFAPVTTVEEAATDVQQGNLVDYGKILGQTFAAGEVADELGLTPSKALEKIPYSENVLTPAREFAERATAKLNDVIVRPLTEYKPTRTAIIVDTGDEKPVVTLSKSPEQASFATIKDIGKIKEIKPVSSVIAETAFNLKTEPVEELAEFRNPVSEGAVKVEGEIAEGTGISKTRLKMGYEIQTEKPVRAIRTITEYSNRLGRKAVLASEIGEDSVKILLKKGDEVKGYGIKVLDSYPIWDQESFGGGLRIFGEAKEAIPAEVETAKVETIDLRDLDDFSKDIEKTTRKALGFDEKEETGRESGFSKSGQSYELRETGGKFKVVDVSDELRSLEKELNEDIKMPDFEKAFERALDFGKDVLDVGAGLGFAGASANSHLDIVGPQKFVTGHVHGSIENTMHNNIISGQKGRARVKESSRSRPDVPPATSTKPGVDVTPDVTPAITPATFVVPSISPEPESKTKSKSKKPEPPVPPFFFPGGGGERFYRVLDAESSIFGRAIKVNPVVDNPLSVMFGGKKGRSRRKKR